MAAELLSGGGMATFDTFSGGCSSMIETEDTISMKKLAKRDSSTREKVSRIYCLHSTLIYQRYTSLQALRELIERCNEDNVDTVVSTFSNFSAQFDKIIFVSA